MSSKSVALGGLAVGGLLTLATLPALLAPTAPASRAACGTVVSGPVEVIEATIRQIESGDNYTSSAAGSSASGAYGFIDQSWANYGGYLRAYLAPAAVQDAKAAEYIATVLAANGNDISIVPVAWYIGHVPAAGSAEWDIVPAPGAGNRLTPRQYQSKWIDVYRSKLSASSGTPSATVGDTTGTTTPPSCSGSAGETFSSGWALPGPRDVLERTADEINNPHHDYPAWDWGIPIGTPVYAIRGGTVISITSNPYNCAGSSTCEACGLGVTIADEAGVQWTYCHGSAQHVNHSDTVTAGQQILSSGNSGNSTGPHVHIGIRTVGVARCPQPLIASLFEHGVGLEPTSLPTSGCTY
jgi:hypothetical protein